MRTTFGFILGLALLAIPSLATASLESVSSGSQATPVIYGASGPGEPQPTRTPGTAPASSGSTAQLIDPCFLTAHLERTSPGANQLAGYGTITCTFPVDLLGIRACVAVDQIPVGWTDVSCNPGSGYTTRPAASFLHSLYAGKTCGRGLHYSAHTYGQAILNYSASTGQSWSAVIVC
jgi:hypothetical protein